MAINDTQHFYCEKCLKLNYKHKIVVHLYSRKFESLLDKIKNMDAHFQCHTQNVTRIIR